MELIKDLGIKPTTYFDKRYNKFSTKRFGLFACTECSRELELPITRGLKQKTCIDCRGTQNTTHGHSRKKYYYVWQMMVQRCINPKNKKFHIYGGKGITVDPNWESFEGFWKDMEDTYEDGLTIDRKDSSKGYNKDNCRWITHSRNSSETTKRRPVIQLRRILKPEKSFIQVKEWESAKKAADELGLVAAHITATCKGNRQTHGGFGWKYIQQKPT